MAEWPGATIPALCHDCGRTYLISKPENDGPDAVCNNYCNLAPEKGPMAARPPPGPDAPQPTAAGEQT